MPLLRGREFTRDDRLNSPRVALVNEAFVRAHFPDSKEPLGEGLRLSFYNGFAMKPYTRFQIVGIVADVRNDSLLLEPQPQILIPAAQIAMEGFFYYVRTARPAASIQAELRQAVWRVHPAIQSVNFRPLADHVEDGLIDRRALSAFGVVVLVVAGMIVAAGLFASLSASVLESGRELAIRAAVGATPVNLAIESLRWALVASGIAGVITAVAVPFIATNVQLEKTTLQPTPSSIILCVLGGCLILVVAAFRPVRKAASSSPVEALREQ